MKLSKLLKAALAVFLLVAPLHAEHKSPRAQNSVPSVEKAKAPKAAAKKKKTKAASRRTAKNRRPPL